jgi:hypothetical protein
VTESEWLACTDFDLLWDTLAPLATPRKRRLFFCAVCRREWHLITGWPRRRAVEVAERYADAQAGPRDLAAAHAAVVRMDPQVPGKDATASMSDDDLADFWSLGSENRPTGPPATPEMWSRLDLLRELIGNPFRPTPAVNAAWLAWHDGAVPQLARAAYEERRLPSGHLDPARLAVLADALEDAGCADAELLGHLRGPGPHVRGCWAVDLILGKG